MRTPFLAAAGEGEAKRSRAECAPNRMQHLTLQIAAGSRPKVSMPFLISDLSQPCADPQCSHTIACHDIYRSPPYPCVIAGCKCRGFLCRITESEISR